MHPVPSAPVADPIPADLRAAQGGDGAAFERLYRAHVGRVNALALRLTGDRVRAAELVQDAFVRAWEKLGSFRGESSFATWMHRLTVNVFLVENRSVRRRGAHEEGWDEPPEVASRDGNDEGAAAGRMDLERALARLPEGARTAFVLHEIEGYSHDEIAALSGVAAGTIRAQLFRARRRLMEELDR